MKTQYIRNVILERSKINNFSEYPFNIPAIKNLENIEINDKVTFFIGENGTGKSTLVESIAISFGFNPEGGSQNFNFSTYKSHSALSEYIHLSKGILRPKDGYFLRAESFYNVASNIEELDLIPSYSPPIKDSYGGSLHECSHGESFFALLNNRLGGNGLYIFDEPEAALSPQRQLSMLCKINELINKNSQIIIATHSPILMSYPNSIIYNLSDRGIEKIEYEETDHYKVTKNFLNNYKGLLKHLLGN